MSLAAAAPASSPARSAPRSCSRRSDSKPRSTRPHNAARRLQPGDASFQVERRWMRRLIQTELAAAGQLDRRPDAPPFSRDFGAADLLRLERLDESLKVVAHQVQMCAEHLVAGVLALTVALVCRMHRQLRGRHAEDQPSVPDIDVLEAEDV